MCEDCLRTQLDLLLVPLAKRDLKRAQRMHRSGHSLVDIGRVLGVSQPVVEAALRAA
jgi:transposase-like protein